MALTHIMEDLETRGTAPGCAIVSIGMAAFTLGSSRSALLDDGFYVIVNYAEQEKLGLHIHDRGPDNTESWWQKQSPEAREAYELSKAGKGVPLVEALEMRNAYIRKHMPSVCVWGNGADFDNAIMAAIYHRAEMRSAQGSFQGRCYRTVKNMAKDVKMVRSGTHHNALDDARSQAQHLIDICQRYKWSPA